MARTEPDHVDSLEPWVLVPWVKFHGWPIARDQLLSLMMRARIAYIEDTEMRLKRHLKTTKCVLKEA